MNLSEAREEETNAEAPVAVAKEAVAKDLSSVAKEVLSSVAKEVRVIAESAVPLVGKRIYREPVPPELLHKRKEKARVVPARIDDGRVVAGLDVVRNAAGLRARLGRALRAMREQAGLTLEDLSRGMRRSIVSARRLEEDGENLDFGDIALWEEVCRDELAICPRAIVRLEQRDSGDVDAADGPGDAADEPGETATTRERGETATTRERPKTAQEVALAAQEQVLAEGPTRDELLARMDRLQRGEARWIAQVSALQDENGRLKGWLRQLGYDC